MNWEKVIEQLRWFARNSHDSANITINNPNFYPPMHGAEVKRHRERADLCSTLAACLEAGLKDEKQ